MAKETKNKKILGEDPGYLDQETQDYVKDLLEKSPKNAELVVYSLFNVCKEGIPMPFSILHPEEIREDYHEAMYACYWLIGQTRHFGVTFEPKVGGPDVYVSDSFMRWYEFWCNCQNSLSKDEWDELLESFSHGGDITPYLPAKAWNEE